MTRSESQRLLEDMHVHSTFSDGQDTIEANIEAAIRQGLRRICCVDHVRAETTWVPEFVDTVREARAKYANRIEVFSGIEAKFINAFGELDLPADYPGVDFILAADHQVPVRRSYLPPGVVRRGVESGAMDPQQIIDWLVQAMSGAMNRYSSIIVAHPFSVLPKIGLTEGDVSDHHLDEIAQTARSTGSRIETSERWQCPGPRITRWFLDSGVNICSSTDAHSADAVGQYSWTRQHLQALSAGAGSTDSDGSRGYAADRLHSRSGHSQAGFTEVVHV